MRFPQLQVIAESVVIVSVAVLVISLPALADGDRFLWLVSHALYFLGAALILVAFMRNRKQDV